jgi:hypothetical protein
LLQRDFHTKRPGSTAATLPGLARLGFAHGACLEVVWQHPIQPLLQEHFHGHSARQAGYNLDCLLAGDSQRPSMRRRTAQIPG